MSSPAPRTPASSTPSSGKLVFLALGLVVGACSGAAVAWVVQKRAHDAYEERLAALGPEAQPASRQATAANAPDLDSSERGSATRTEASATAPAQTDVFGDLQRAYGRAGIERGWASQRTDKIGPEDMNAGLVQYEKMVRDAPEHLGAELARRKTKTEEAERDAKSGGVLTLLDKLAKGDAGPVLDAVRDPKRFAEFFPRQTGEIFVDGPSARPRPEDKLENGATLTFPAGVFSLRELMVGRDHFPSDVTVAGAGMDATLLVLENGSLYTRGQLVRFSIRDCTVYTQGWYLLDLRNEPASLIFERARFIGFDSGGGSSVLLGAAVHGFALHATDCRFEGGYGPSPQHGNLFDVRNDALIARFDRCRFDDLHANVAAFSAGVTLVFSDCVLTNMLDQRTLTDQAATKPGVIFEGCSFTYFGGEPSQAPKKDLDLLFPDWKHRKQ